MATLRRPRSRRRASPSSGTHAELIARGGRYRTLHDTQFRDDAPVA